MPSVTVATLNLRKGELRWGERAPLLFDQLARLRPDIIGFQEVDVRLDQGNYICQRLNDLIWSQEEPRVYRIHHMAYPRENLTVEALGIMTHLPVKEHEGFDYLVRNRVAHRLRLDIGGHDLDFYNTHFHHEQDKPGLDLRREQAEKLTAWISSHSQGVPAVLVGDFNCIPQSAPMQTISARLTSVFESLAIEAPKTIPTPLDPKYPGHWAIDHIFASPDVQVLEARRVFDEPHTDDETLCCSDHYGLLASVEIA
jgi:endonuclease/exonuclease/phosphatase family metal-dependent hydrolase